MTEEQLVLDLDDKEGTVYMLSATDKDAVEKLNIHVRGMLLHSEGIGNTLDWKKFNSFKEDVAIRRALREQC